ncbi:hypothetical protein KP509_34G069000 [Ceratopteris richardii]|uniref:Uncharacterized protein n=1 Tax=Ceratopteris richardii TaxID=49495 RepID=A0A8T2QKR4_CERRI|nr:hypothetical protein KP509_34G069000 [Ceratopteris richardii]
MTAEPRKLDSSPLIPKRARPSAVGSSLSRSNEAQQHLQGRRPGQTMKRVRVVFTDPDATESSSDEQEISVTSSSRERTKRVVQQMFVPIASTTISPFQKGREANVFSTGSETQVDAIDLPVLPGLSRISRRNSSKYWPRPSLPKQKKRVGVRQRRWGRWKVNSRHVDPSYGESVVAASLNSSEALLAQEVAASDLCEIDMLFREGFLSDTATPAGSSMYSSESFEPLFCPELKDMSKCFLPHSPSSVLEVSTNFQAGSPASEFDMTFSDCSSPRRRAPDIDAASIPVQELSQYLTDCIIPHPSAVEEPLFEACGDNSFVNVKSEPSSLNDSLFEDLNVGTEDKLSCYDIASFTDPEDEHGNINLMSFELDAEALTWIDIQPDL